MKLYPEIILSAKDNGLQANAFRLWFIAKDYCQGRRGAIPVKALRNHLKALGISRATYSRWISAALEYGLIERVKSERLGFDLYSLAGWARGAALAGCERLGKPANVELMSFAGRSWISYSWAAFLTRFEEKPVSRDTLNTLAAVPIRTQQYREKRAKIKQKTNIAVWGNYQEISQKNPEFLISYCETPGLFIDKLSGDLCQQLPNSRTIPEGISPANKGSTRKVNGALKALLNREAEARQCPPLRYSNSAKETKRIERSIRQRGDITNPVTIYERGRVRKGIQKWNALRV